MNSILHKCAYSVSGRPAQNTKAGFGM